MGVEYGFTEKITEQRLGSSRIARVHEDQEEQQIEIGQLGKRELQIGD